jgi:hypothetical protein
LRRIIFIAGLLISACAGKNSQDATDNQTVEVDSASEYYKDPQEEIVYNYRAFAGIYDHESNTKGFTAVLNITESGNDLSFTISVSQGACKGEAEGKITMVSHDKNSHSGFYELSDCPLQFTFLVQENKIDVKEVSLCQLHESGCAFEGTYVKRKR